MTTAGRTVPSGAHWLRVKELLAQALELPPAAQREFLAGLEPALADELRELLAAESDPGFLAAPALEQLEEGALPARAAALPERIGPWRIEALLGQGGMGAVYRALRAEGGFEQRVALKVMRPELVEPELARRFGAERRILAGLEHPNIARLIDGGTTAAGLSYLALELVVGEPLDAYANGNELSVRKRLELVREVAGAVEYAHRKLVLHRDLKPSNILVDARGTVKLLDFGIAKLLAPESRNEAETQLSLWRPLTPGYASPEQLLGQELTTASDVYSLGVLLFELLTGRLPHKSRELSAAELARKIAVADPPRLVSAGTEANLPPGVSKADLARDLEGVVGKALAAETNARYRSAGDLAADLDRYLAGRAVEAHPPTFGYRARKFVARHRLGTVSAAVILCTLVAATLFSLQQAEKARAERARALSSLSDLRGMANELIFKIDEDIRTLTDATPARERLVATALSYLERLSHEAGDDPTFLTELAGGYIRIGELQGMPYTNNLGKSEEGLANLRRGAELARRALVLQPDEPQSLSLLARALDGAGAIAAERGEDEAAITAYEAAIAALERVTDPEAKNEQALTLARLRDQIAQVHLSLGAFDRALALLRENEGQMSALAERSPEDRAVRRGLYRAHLILGDAHFVSGHAADALDRYRAADVIASDLADGAAPASDAARDRFVSMDRAARTLVELGRTAEALPILTEVLALTARAVEADATNEITQRDRASALQFAADTYFALHDYPRALAQYRASAVVFERLAAGGNPRLRQAWAGMELYVGITLARLDRKEEALAALEGAEEAMSGALASDTNSFDGAMLLSHIHRHLAQLLAEKGHFERALRLARQSLAATVSQRKAQPNDLGSVAEAADASFRLAAVLELAEGRARPTSEACTLYRESQELWLKVPTHQAPFPDGAPRTAVEKAAARCAPPG